MESSKPEMDVMNLSVPTCGERTEGAYTEAKKPRGEMLTLRRGFQGNGHDFGAKRDP